MRKFILLLLLLCLAATTSADFSKVGSAGAQFLKIGVGSKYQAMGEASVAITDDVYSMFWNPAGLVGVESWGVGFTNVNWFTDIDLNYVGFAHNFEDVGIFGVSATVLSMGDQEITTFEEPDGTGNYYTASSYAVGLSYARQVTAKFAFGGSVKYVGERIHHENAATVALDFGTLLYTGFRSLRMGMSITNMGPDMEFTGSDLDVSWDQRESEGTNPSVGASIKTTAYNLPMTFRFGMAYDWEMAPNSIVTLSAEAKHPNDMNQQGAVGAQFAFSDKFFLRTGYKMNYDEEGLTLGGGLSTKVSKYTRLLIDYAWQDFGNLASTQRFSVGFAF